MNTAAANSVTVPVNQRFVAMRPEIPSNINLTPLNRMPSFALLLQVHCYVIKLIPLNDLVTVRVFTCHCPPITHAHPLGEF